jgi:hypothetical protein
MSYIVKVVGYNAFWSGISEPGKVWTENIDEAKKFSSKDEGEEIVNSGMNMECIEYDENTIINDASVLPWSQIGIETEDSTETPTEIITDELEEVLCPEDFVEITVK